MDVAGFLSKATDFNLLPETREVEGMMTARPAFEWAVDQPPTPDQRAHRTFVTPPIDRPGKWLVVASQRPDFTSRDNLRTAVFLGVGDLVLQHRVEDEGLRVEVLSGETGMPAPGVEVLLYRLDWQARHKVQQTARTDASGSVVFPRVNTPQRSWLLVARHGDDIALNYNPIWMPGPREKPQTTTSTLVYTDRSVYRPGQAVLFKVVAFEGIASEGRYHVMTGQTLDVHLRDANGEVVREVRLTTAVLGSTAGSVVTAS